ncbi:MAG: class I SAM-dependent methyltransferase [Candidatus Hodarchaeales archaeon]
MRNKNENFLSDAEKQLLDAVLSLEIQPYANKEEIDEKIKQGERLVSTFENICKRGKLIQSIMSGTQLKLVDWTNSVETLLNKEFLQKNRQIYVLTSIGRSQAKNVRGDRIGKRFSDTLIRSDKSKAHSTFCYNVFGKDLNQANMMDMVQLEKLLEVLDLSSANRVLAVACGVGRIAEYISDITGAHVLGIDIATDAIKYAQERTREKKDRLEFRVGDINDLDLPQANRDTVFGIAALHYSDDLNSTISQMKSILNPNGQMGFFTFQYCSKADSPEILQPKNTLLAHTLKKNDLSFQTWDFTDKEIEIRRKQIHFARELMEEYRQEGNLDLCEDRIEECEIDLPRLETGKKRRYLYHVHSSYD